MSSLCAKYTVFFLLVSGLYAGYGQSVQFKHITVNEGLTHNHVTSLYRASDGFLWIGTPAGLNRFDGHSVRMYKNRSGSPATLKDNSVSQIFEGPGGNLWVRTGLGLNVLDIRRDAFSGNTDSLLRTMGIREGNILDICRDKNGYFWFLHAEEGLFRYDEKQNRSIPYRGRRDSRPTGMALGGKNTVWVIFADGTFETVNALTLETMSVRRPGNPENSEFRILVDRNEDPWIYTANTPSGVYWWPDFSQPPIHFSVNTPGARLNNNTVMGLAQDQEGRVWIATDHGGVNLFDPKNRKMSYLMYEEFNDRSLSHNGTSTVICDSDGMIWIGTYKGGVNYYHDNLIQFPVYRHHSTAPASLPYDDVNRVIEDRNGNLWIGTNGGGLIFYDKQKNTYRQYLHSPDDPSSLGSNVIVSLLLDREDNLWVGTYHGGLNLFRNGRFKRYVHDPATPESISNNSVWELFEDSEGRFWVGTLFGGVNLMDRRKGTFLKPPGDFTGPSATYICAMMEDREGNLWFGSATGIEVRDKSGQKITRYAYEPAKKGGLSNDYISDLLQDSKGRIWVATRDGLNLFERGTFRVFKDTDGLRDNTIHTLLEDNAGKIWMSTSKGLSVLSDSREGGWVIRNFDQHDGLQSVAFNENAAVKLRSGELIFGGPAGYNRIRPEDISHEEVFPRPVISDLLLFNRSVGVGEVVEGRVLLKQAMEYTDEIVLKYDQNVFSLRISPLYFLHPERVRIRYTLDGFNREWLELDPSSRVATFTNLNAGEYIFKVITSTDGEQWSEPVTLLKIVIRPPFWLTGWAYAFYLLCIGGVLLAVRLMERRRQYTRFVLQQEREEARRLKELDQLKTRFFTNVSHEFRTPVSLIISPIEKLAREEKDAARKMHLDLVHRNARRLLNLVNQLLDFRKIDTRSLQLQNTEGDIMAQIDDHARSFRDMAESKEIEYFIDISAKGVRCYFDQDKLERIVFNLLSNAFKFTPVGGKVSLTAALEKDGTDAYRLKLEVEDTGIGITEESRSRIFERYYQDDILQSLLNQGSGIGLSITREYIHLMGGTIEVNSEVDAGSRFAVSLPVHGNGPATAGNSPVFPVKPEVKSGITGKRVLVVEDNEDFRFYILDNLREHYQVEEARNFTEGWEKTLAFHPDIVVSDVNMPGNTGIELCRKLKSDARTMHIPVILLTALTADNYQLEGTEAGAADYIVKPFNVELLLSKIKSHIRQKTSFEKTYKKQLVVEPAETELESLDEKFMRKTLEVVEKNISNTLFSVEMLADEMNVSRVGLYKKVFSLTGYSPSEFIRNIRLKRAARLLEETGMTVAEVAYEAGFNNPKTFSKYFRDIFGKLPSDYRKGN
ncbi:two-component regulator propeller domain-containing protein [Leadbetterella sp. DM7]|uniref:two-component regulator propeller domain-containing protein n=1 Tax=Leadbetterella sp. DM7 TaxID=3235085 RepID=UPI00349EF6C0